MDFRDILYEKQGGIATITLNRPQTLNALTATMSQEWAQAIKDAQEDDEVRVVVITGAGRAFCAGLNPRELAAGRTEVLQAEDMLETVMGLEKPYIAAINGPAAGGGMSMATLCDIRIASDRAQFVLAHLRMGGVAGSGLYWLLPRLIGVSRTLDLAWTCRRFDAQEALAMGYVDRVVPHAELMAATGELASRLAQGPPIAMRLVKHLVYEGLSVSLRESLEAHRRAQRLTKDTEDAKEGPRAWVEKREPHFQGR